MKKYLKYCLSAGLLLALSIGTVSTASAESKAKTYKNCTELNKVYKVESPFPAQPKTKVEKRNINLLYRRRSMKPTKKATVIKTESLVRNKIYP